MQHVRLHAIAIMSGLLPLVCSSAPDAERRVATVMVEPERAGSDAVVTFAHPFTKGDVPGGLTVRSGKRKLPHQIDVKRRHTDGSVKHAVISAALGTVRANLAYYAGLVPRPDVGFHAVTDTPPAARRLLK